MGEFVAFIFVIVIVQLELVVDELENVQVGVADIVPDPDNLGHYTTEIVVGIVSMIIPVDKSGSVNMNEIEQLLSTETELLVVAKLLLYILLTADIVLEPAYFQYPRALSTTNLIEEVGRIERGI